MVSFVNAGLGVSPLGSVPRRLLRLPIFGPDGALVPGRYVETRSSDLLLPDDEGLLTAIPGGVLPYEGARYVTNLAAATDTPSTQSITTVVGNEYVVSIAGAVSSTAILSNAATDTITNDGVNRVSHPGDAPVTASTTTLTITLSGSVTDLLVEDVTGRTNQNPSKYVSSTIGTQLFNIANGNTVSSGVVIEALGALLSPQPKLTHVPGSTNEFLNSETPVTQVITVGNGDWTTSVFGSGTVTTSAGTATGTGFGAATDGSDNTINITIGGTVTLTVTGGPPDIVMFENLIRRTAPIVTLGSPASRDDVAIQHTQTNAFDPTQGTVMMQMEMVDASQTESGVRGVLNTRGGGSSVLYMAATSGRLESADGTSFLGVTIGWAAGDAIVIVVTYSSSGFSLHVRNITQAGAWVHTGDLAFDGAYDITGGLLEYFLSQTHKIFLIDHEILADPLPSDDAVERRYGN